MRAVITSPDDEDWFYEALNDLIGKYGKDQVLEFVKNKQPSAYILCILIKGGLKGVDEILLHEFLDKNDENEVYDAALSLAIYGHPIGFETLYKFADMSHELSNHIIPKLDILPDLKFIKNPKAKELEDYINCKYSNMKIE